MSQNMFGNSNELMKHGYILQHFLHKNLPIVFLRFTRLSSSNRSPKAVSSIVGGEPGVINGFEFSIPAPASVTTGTGIAEDPEFSAPG